MRPGPGRQSKKRRDLRLNPPRHLLAARVTEIADPTDVTEIADTTALSPPARRAGQHQRKLIRRYALPAHVALVVIALVAVVVGHVAGVDTRLFVITES